MSSWKIISSKDPHKLKIVPVHSILSIGNLADCDIQIEHHQPCLDSQLILDSFFGFHIKKNTVKTFFKNDVCRFSNEKFNLEFNAMTPWQPIDYDQLPYVYTSNKYAELLEKVQTALSQNQFFQFEALSFEPEHVIQKACQMLDGTFWVEHSVFCSKSRSTFIHLVWCVWSQICEYGLLTLPLQDNKVSEIMVNGCQDIYLERNGCLEKSTLAFRNEQELCAAIERMCHAVGRRIDEGQPFCNARLKDGSRVHAIIPPLSLNGACLTIRKFPVSAVTSAQLVALDCMTPDCFDFLCSLVKSRKNILISGGTGTGKTTLLNCLSEFIDHSERIITIEDAAELRLKQDHVIRLESRNENIEKQGEVSIRDLVRNALRMRPDRIIVGECRGGEALDMLQAMNTGHDGSMTTVHANSPIDALRRLETLVLFAQYDLPSRAIREQITSAIHFIVQLKRLPTGKRIISEIHSVTGLCQQTGQFLSTVFFQKES